MSSKDELSRVDLQNFKLVLGDEFEALRGELSEEELDTFLNQRNFEKDLGRRKLLAKALRSDWLKGPKEDESNKRRLQIVAEDVDVGLVIPITAVDEWLDTKHMQYSLLAETKRIYIRQDCFKLWAELEKNTNIFINGAPGTGKSTLAWHWCIYKASKGASIRWVHFDRDGQRQMVEFKNGQFKVMRDFRDDFKTEASIFVLDEIGPNFTSDVAHYCLKYTFDSKIRLVLVSSLATNWRGTEFQKYAMNTFTMSGWTLEEYKSACKDVSFQTLVDPQLDADLLAQTLEDKIAAKFDIAGHSARWMFNFNTAAAIKDLSSATERVQNWKNFLEVLAGVESSSITHTLISLFENGKKRVIVSPFAVRILTTRLDLRFIAKLTNWGIHEQNNALLGWIFQADFLARIEHNLIISFTEKEEWNASSSFVKIYQFSEIKSGDLVDGKWLIPTKLNQGCFDCLQIFPSNGIVRSVQLTVSNHHTAKLQYLGAALNQLVKLGFMIKKLDMVFVVPVGVNFHLSSSNVTLNPIVTATSWKIGDERSLHFIRANEISNFLTK